MIRATARDAARFGLAWLLIIALVFGGPWLLLGVAWVLDYVLVAATGGLLAGCAAISSIR